MAKSKLLMTGMSGLIGGALRGRLEADYELSALNRGAVEGLPCHQADIADLEAILPAFAEQEIVVHLAALASMSAGFDELLRNNIVGTYNVFEAARRSGVKRVVYASSGATVGKVELELPYKALVAGVEDDVPDRWKKLTHESPVRPAGLYGCTKVWGEALARHFVDTSDLSIICLRIGAVNKEDRPLTPRQQSVWCSRRDIVDLLAACVEAPDDLKYDIFFGVSNNRLSYRDMEHPRRMLDFAPQDSADDRG